MMVPNAFPLTWPANMPRTKSKARSQFRTGLPGALKNVATSIALFEKDTGKKVENLVISSNVTLGVDDPADTGVAVWFVWDGLQVCIPIDRYPKVQDNVQAIHRVIEARREEMRHGGLNIVRATFTGFQALPAPASKRPWRAILGFATFDGVSADGVEARFKKLAKERHPDAGGSDEAMAELNQARWEALREIEGA